MLRTDSRSAIAVPCVARAAAFVYRLRLEPQSCRWRFRRGREHACYHRFGIRWMQERLARKRIHLRARVPRARIHLHGARPTAARCSANSMPSRSGWRPCRRRLWRQAHRRQRSAASLEVGEHA
jgi:hypothetical protein